jgi:hypothetical protein
MMFCVYLTAYSGDKLPPFYIGAVRASLVGNTNAAASWKAKR